MPGQADCGREYGLYLLATDQLPEIPSIGPIADSLSSSLLIEPEENPVVGVKNGIKSVITNWKGFPHSILPGYEQVANGFRYFCGQN